MCSLCHAQHDPYGKVLLEYKTQKGKGAGRRNGAKCAVVQSVVALEAWAKECIAFVTLGPRGQESSIDFTIGAEGVGMKYLDGLGPRSMSLSYGQSALHLDALYL